MPRPSKGDRHAVKAALAQPVRQRLLAISRDAGAAALGPYIGDLLACSVGLPELCLEVHQDALPLPTVDVSAEMLVLPLLIGSQRSSDIAVHPVMVRLPVAVYDRVVLSARDNGVSQIGRYIADWCASYVGLPELARTRIRQDVLPLIVAPSASRFRGEDMAITA